MRSMRSSGSSIPTCTCMPQMTRRRAGAWMVAGQRDIALAIRRLLAVPFGEGMGGGGDRRQAMDCRRPPPRPGAARPARRGPRRGCRRRRCRPRSEPAGIPASPGWAAAPGIRSASPAGGSLARSRLARSTSRYSSSMPRVKLGSAHAGMPCKSGCARISSKRGARRLRPGLRRHGGCRSGPGAIPAAHGPAPRARHASPRHSRARPGRHKAGCRRRRWRDRGRGPRAGESPAGRPRSRERRYARAARSRCITGREAVERDQGRRPAGRAHPADLTGDRVMIGPEAGLGARRRAPPRRGADFPARRTSS